MVGSNPTCRVYNNYIMAGIGRRLYAKMVDQIRIMGSRDDHHVR